MRSRSSLELECRSWCGLWLAFILFTLGIARCWADEQPVIVDPVELFAGANAAMKQLSQQDEQMLLAAKSALELARPGDEIWAAALERIDLFTSTLEFSFTRPEDLMDFGEQEKRARAYRDAQEQKIQVTQMKMIELRDHAQAVSMYLIEELTGGVPSDAYATAKVWIKTEVLTNLIAWLVAHEAAHHQLGHAGSRPKSLAESRARELEADKMAFELINAAGYSLFLVQRYLNLVADYEYLRWRMGLVKNPESRSRHPSWRSRADAVNHFVATHSPADHRWRMYTTATATALDSRPMPTVFLLPPAGWAVGVLMRGKTMKPIGVEYGNDGSVTLFERLDGMVDSHRIERTDDYRTSVFQSNARTGVSTSGWAYRSGITSVAVLDKTGTLQKARGYDPVMRAKAFVVAVDATPDERAKALDSVTAVIRRNNRLVLSYFKGEIEAQTLETAMKQNESQARDEMNRILGPGMAEIVFSAIRPEF